MDQKLTKLEQLLNRIQEAAQDGDRVSLGAILEVVGRSSFGPLLLVAGLVTLAPLIGDIPGVPTIMAMLVLLTAGQLLFGRQRIWLPRWLLRRSVPRNKLCKALDWLRAPARFVGRFLRRRLTIFTQSAGIYVIAIVCIVIAAAMPVMELLPFSANGAGAALTAFGLSLIAHDGLLSLLALVFTVATFGLVVYHLLWPEITWGSGPDIEPTTVAAHAPGWQNAWFAGWQPDPLLIAATVIAVAGTLLARTADELADGPQEFQVTVGSSLHMILRRRIVGVIAFLEGYYLGPIGGIGWVIGALALTIILAIGWMRSYWMGRTIFPNRFRFCV